MFIGITHPLKWRIAVNTLITDSRLYNFTTNRNIIVMDGYIYMTILMHLYNNEVYHEDNIKLIDHWNIFYEQ